MSDTRGHKKSQSQYDMGSRKMKPYLSDHARGTMKEVVSLGRGTGISKLGKLVTKNANRAQKKAARQQGQYLTNELLTEDLKDVKEPNFTTEKGQWLVWYMLKERCDINSACEALRDKEHPNIF